MNANPRWHAIVSRRMLYTVLPVLLAAGLGTIALLRLRAGPPQVEQNRLGGALAGPRKGSSPVDLLQVIDLSRDAIAGVWRFDGGTLLTPRVQWARLQVPCAPPEEYDLRIVALREQGSDSLNIGFIYGGRQGMLMVDGNGGSTSWVDLTTPYDLSANETAAAGSRLRENRRATIVIAVRRSGVAVSVDGEKVISWGGPPAELKLISGYRIPREDALFVGSWETVFRIFEVSLVPIAGEPRFFHP